MKQQRNPNLITVLLTCTFSSCVCILGEDMGMNGIMTSPVIERVPMSDGCLIVSMNEMCFYQLFFRLLLCLAETISLPKIKRWEWQLLLNFSP